MTMFTILAALLLMYSSLDTSTFWASQYAPGVMERVVAYRNLRPAVVEVTGYIAVISCAELGNVWWLRPAGSSIPFEPYQVADCSGHANTTAWMQRNNIQVELDYPTAKRFNTVGRGLKMERLTMNCEINGISLSLPYDAPRLAVNNVDGEMYISERLNNSEFDYWIVFRREPDDDTLYLSAVAPSLIDKDLLAKFRADNNNDDEAVAIDVASYGIVAQIGWCSGDDADAVLRYAQQVASAVSALFGFVMDAPQNQVGSTGWDFLAGDVMAGLRRQEQAVTL